LPSCQLHISVNRTAQIYLELHFCVELHSKKALRYVKPFSSDTGTLRTDRQTDGFAISVSREKLGWRGYPWWTMVWGHVSPFQHNTCAWRTDGKTDTLRQQSAQCVASRVKNWCNINDQKYDLPPFCKRFWMLTRDIDIALFCPSVRLSRSGMHIHHNFFSLW